MKKIPVREFMSRDRTAARADMPLTELVSLFTEHSVRALPVTDADGVLLGVVSETDLFLKEKGVAFSLEKVPTLLGKVIDPKEVNKFERTRRVLVDEVMSSRAVTASEDDTLEAVTMLMFRNRLSLLPVTAEGTLVGVLRRIDVLRKIYGV